MIIEKSQFKDYVKFSDNIAEKDIAYNIKDAESFDLKPLIPVELYDAIVLLTSLNVKQWARTTTYQINEYCFSPVNNKKYKAIRITLGDEPSISVSDWSEVEAFTLFDEYIKPYLIYCAYLRFLLWSGRNIAQSGLRQMVDEASSEISDKARGELMADIDNKKSFAWSMFEKYISDNSYTFDGVLYNFTNNNCISSPRRNFKIRAV